MPLTAEEIRQNFNQNVETKDINVDGLGEIRIRVLSAASIMTMIGKYKELIGLAEKAEEEDFVEVDLDKPEAVSLMIDVACESIIDSEGNLCFADEEGRAFVTQWNPTLLQQVSTEVFALNGLTKDSEKDAKKN